MIVSLLPLEGGDGLLIPLLPPSSGRRWRVAPEVGFALFSFSQPPALRASPFHGKGVDGLLIPLLPPSSGRRWRIAPEVGFTLFRFQPTPALRASPFPEEGGWVTHPASPSFLWKEVARSAGGWLRSFSLSANPLPFGHPPALRASPFHGKGVDALLIHSSTLHYPFTENGFQISATFIELKMNLKVGQSHYF